MKQDIILFGPPGAGKGTQGQLLAQHFGLLRLSTGDVLRDATRRGTDMGRAAKRFMDAGDLVPDEVILGIVRDYLRGEAADRGVIFDGFPRTIPQAQGLDELLAELGRPFFGVLVLAADDEVLVKRLSGRRSCTECGALYNIHFDPPREDGRCTVCGSVLILRPDDEAATVRHRLEVYHEQTEPLLDYFKQAGAAVVRMNGHRPVAEVQRDLIEVLTR
jgi:adenylate kinase